MKPVVIGNATLYLGDCLEILPTLPKVDAVITDPPYGIGAAWGDERGLQVRKGQGRGSSRLWQGEPGWDVRPDSGLLNALIDKPAIIWGGNYFDSLPASKAWLIWDKVADTTQAHAELAWTNCAPTVRVFRQSTLGAFGNGGANGEIKEHPTQKPTALMAWCVRFVPSGVVLDPFMGSGSTGVACVQLSRSFIGIEREPRYFDIACRRIEEAQRQQPLIPHEPPKAEQMEIGA